jgi:hypothetical protein
VFQVGLNRRLKRREILVFDEDAALRAMYGPASLQVMQTTRFAALKSTESVFSMSSIKRKIGEERVKTSNRRAVYVIL